MDIWLQPDNENLQKLLSALKDFDIEETGLEHVRKFDLTTPQMFFVGNKPRRIDFLNIVTGISFNEAILQVNYFPLQDKQVPVNPTFWKYNSQVVWNDPWGYISISIPVLSISSTNGSLSMEKSLVL